MDASQAPAEADLARMSNEHLVSLIQESQSIAAINEMVLRFRDLANRFIASHARRCKLSPVDREDAQSEALFGIREAARKFDTHKRTRKSNDPVRTFVLVVLHSRFGLLTQNRRISKLISSSPSKIQTLCHLVNKALRKPLKTRGF